MIDPDALMRLREWGGSKLLAEMVRLFLENSSERLGQLGKGFADGDLRTVERAAHSLKSSAANVGAMEVSRVSQQIEAAAEGGDTDTARKLFDALVPAHEEACQRLREIEAGVKNEA